MNTLDFLAKLERLNVKLSLAGYRLRLEAPAGTLTPKLAVLGDVLGLKVIPAPKRGRETAQEAFFCLG